MSGTAAVVLPVLKNSPDARRSAASRLKEACGLAQAIQLDVAWSEAVAVAQPKAATLLGAGAVERLKDDIGESGVDLVVVDAALSPIQQRNLERAWRCKVIDRTGLILEIFGARARTREGRLQVELAALTYQRSRLVRSWTHLERQRGGFGFMGGPGETQIEADRRQIDTRISRIKAELDNVRRTRGLHRKARRRVPFPVVALVGYTNAGKSTLFNRLTKADVRAENLLFATLDPTMRAVVLPSGRTVILSDTVGFVSDLPTDLVAAFRATLEEVLEADIIVHVRDIAHPDSDAQKLDVEQVLTELGLDPNGEDSMIEVLNKIDLLPPEEKDAVLTLCRRNAGMASVSALTGEGTRSFLWFLDRRVNAHRRIYRYRLGPGDGAAISWLYDHGEVVGREEAGGGDELVAVWLEPVDAERFDHPPVQDAPPPSEDRAAE